MPLRAGTELKYVRTACTDWPIGRGFGLRSTWKWAARLFSGRYYFLYLLDILLSPYLVVTLVNFKVGKDPE